MATKKIITTQDKIDTITSATKFTATELLNLPTTKFEEIYLDVVAMNKAISAVQIHEILLHAGTSNT
jgi:hypothetical protein